MKNILIMMFVLFTGAAVAQEVQIIDKSTGKSIPNVSVVNFDESHNTLSNKDGVADLSIFSPTDSLIFLHTSFQSVLISMKELKEAEYVLNMFPSVIHLEETVVSANRWEQRKREVSMHIAHMEKKDIQEMEAQTSADMLGASGQVFIQKSQMGGGSPMIRGFSSNKVLIVVDGIRMNNPIYRHGNLQNVISVDPNALHSSEVVFGPGSVIYGSDAIGGVMDFHTLNHKFSETGELMYSGNALLRYNSGNEEKTGHFDVNISTIKFSSITSVSFSDYGDLHMGENGIDQDLRQYYTRDNVALRNDDRDTIVPNYDRYLARGSGFQQMNVMQKFAYRLTENSSLEYAFHYSSTGNVPRYDRLVQLSSGDLKYAQWYYGPQKWIMHALKFENHNKSAFYDDVKVQFAYQDYEESRHDRKMNKEELRHRTEQVKMLTLNADLFKALNSKHAVFYGFEGSMSKIFSFGHMENLFTNVKTPVASRYPDNSDYSTAALYASYRYLISSKTTLNAGVRLNGVYSYSPFNDEFYSFPFNKIELKAMAPNAMLGFVYNPHKTWQMNLNLSTGYRAPNIDDIGKVFDSEPGAVVVPNDNLQAEYAYNIDFSTSKSLFSFMRVDCGGFYTILNNAMIRDDFTFNGQDFIMYDGEPSRVQAIQNIGRVDVYGAFGGVYMDLFKNVSLKSQINWTKGFDQNSDPYRHVAPVFGQTHLLFTFGRLKIDASAVYNGEISPNELSPEEHGKSHMYTIDADYASRQALLPENERFNEDGLYSPAWYSLNLKANYRLNQNMQLSAGVSNITDQLYRPYSSGIPAMGRSYLISLRAGF